ncbi:hypothetical protein [Sporomusa sp.]|uniref:hypothetical protein n=1 Tax=Sporomusa sp. TaxID=2078658 RepID=UPI002C184099|nr:hypothetical protein [Sporomusa sp.]HWR05945.1 hypothetical protein [Sporomusa sp.]
MSQERFDHQEKMLEQLIHMVGHNNTITEELCQRMDRLEIKVDNLEVKVNSLETKVNSLEIKVDSGFEGLTGMVHLLGDKTEAIPRIESKLDVLNSRVFEQEADINLLKRAK